MEYYLTVAPSVRIHSILRRTLFYGIITWGTSRRQYTSYIESEALQFVAVLLRPLIFRIPFAKPRLHVWFRIRLEDFQGRSEGQRGNQRGQRGDCVSVTLNRLMFTTFSEIFTASEYTKERTFFSNLRFTTTLNRRVRSQRNECKMKTNNFLLTNDDQLTSIRRR